MSSINLKIIKVFLEIFSGVFEELKLREINEAKGGWGLKVGGWRG